MKLDDIVLIGATVVLAGYLYWAKNTDKPPKKGWGLVKFLIL